MSTTSDYLITHASQNVWCSPEQDDQFILRPKRISRAQGTRRDLEVLWSKINMPTVADWYHVFQIGEVDPTALGLNGRLMTWVSFQEHCNKERLFVDLYTKSGLQIPKFMGYVLVTLDGNVLIAIKHEPALVDMGVEDLYVRFYSNSYFQSMEDDTEPAIHVSGGIIRDLNHRAAWLASYRSYVERPGKVFGFVNGYRVASLNLQTVAVGDRAEFIWDSSIKAEYELPLSSLAEFHSELDTKQKFLLHWQGQASTIEYRDDIELYLIRRTNANIYKGVYYHRNVEDAVRMVTHKDYSIPVQYVRGYLEDNPWLGRTEDVSVLLYLRHSGYNRPLIKEHHRIHELYKLDEADLVDAMVGTEATVPEWHARNLEKSFYPALMRHVGRPTDLTLIQKAYGYNSISKLVADTPQRIAVPGDWVQLPVGLQTNSTVYEYDANGVLLTWRVHGRGRSYTPQNAACRYIEAVVGKGGPRLSTQYNANNVALSPDLNYRMYVRAANEGIGTGEWRDVTGNSDYYLIVNGHIEWKVDFDTHETAIKDDLNFLCYGLDLDYRDGINRFTINVDEVRTDNLSHPDKAAIPFGTFDIWLNGRPLIRDLDYFVHWPEIVVVNKQYLIPDGPQRFLFRGMGFCNPDMTMPALGDFGFVKHGKLSKNKRYDVRDDKVVRIVVDGRLYSRERLAFGEDANDEISVADVQNGAPYVITDVIVPLRNLVNEDTYTMRARSLEVDKRVEDYLTIKKPEPVEPNPNMIPNLYQIYSPFASKVTHDLAQGILRMDDFQTHYSDLDLREVLRPYEWLLPYDPCFKELDLDYVSIHPHNEMRVITLDVYQWRFLKRTIDLMLNGKVDITKFVRIETGFEHETPDHPHPYRVAPGHE